MNKEDIIKKLHHRDPYLMIDKVIEISPKYIKAIKTHHGAEPYLLGHFPNAPIVPGAMLQEICTQAAGLLITTHHSPVKDYNSDKTKGWALGVLNKVEFAKYLEIVKPKLEIFAEVHLVENHNQLFKFQAKIFQNQILKAKLKFNLVNISDQYLYQE